MQHSIARFEAVRYSTRVFALVLQVVLAAAGGYVAYHVPGRATDWEWLVFAADALLCALMLPLLLRARRRGDAATMDRIGELLLALGSLLVLQRVAYAYNGPLLHDLLSLTFRPILAFVPFVYVAAIAMVPVRRALFFCWGYWALLSLVVLVGVYRQSGLMLQNPGTALALAWLLVGNPLLILMLHALPRYEDWLLQARSELEERARLQQGLRESEDRFNLIVESLEVGAWDRRRTPTPSLWWSPTLFRMLGLKQTGAPPDWRDFEACIHPDERESVTNEIRSQVEASGRVNLDFRMRDAHGEYRWVNARARTHHDPDTGTERWVGAVSDVHVRYQLQEQLKEAHTELIKLAYLDGLTNLHNRRAFDDWLVAEWLRSRRDSTLLSVLVLDLDHFKPYNDRYGHAAGDQALIAAAEVFNANIRRPGDFAARTGGEEFAIVLPATDGAGALVVARKIVDAVAQLNLPHAASPLGRVTVSIGVATSQDDMAGPEALLEAADRALYRAKDAGRNRCESA